MIPSFYSLRMGILAAVLFPAFVLAEPSPQIYVDRGGMPRCLEAEHQTSVLLKWVKREKYQRTLYAVPLTRHLAELVLQNGRQMSQVRDQDLLPCRSWERFTGSIPLSYGSPVESGVSEIEGFPLPDWARRAIAQLRLGADEVHEDTASEYLAQHPILPPQTFDFDLNRSLTARFGVAFSSLIFREWVLSQPTNRDFLAEVRAQLKSGWKPEAGSLAPLFHDRIVVRVLGLGHETRSSQRFEVFTDQLKALGVPMISVESGSMDPVEKNVAITREVFDRLLGQGKNIIVLAQSKGGTEAIEALAQLSGKLEGPGRPKGYGRVEAYIGMSGVYAHSFLIEWAGRIPQWWIIRHELKKSLESEGATVTTLDGFLDLAEDPMREYATRVSSHGLPQKTVYLNIVGAVGGNGLAGDESVRKVQDDLIRAQLSRFGANDGYIEFPGTVLPSAWATRALTVVLDGSHALVDGTFDGLSLKDPAQDREVAAALMSALLNHVSN